MISASSRCRPKKTQLILCRNVSGASGANTGCAHWHATVPLVQGALKKCHNNANWMGWNPAIVNVLIPFDSQFTKNPRTKKHGSKIWKNTFFFFHFFPYRFSDLLMGIASGAGASNWPSHSPHSDATVWRGQSRFVTVGSKLVFFPQVWGMNICLTSINYP